MGPSKSRFFRCNRRVSAHVRHQMNLNDQAGIRMSKTFGSIVHEAGGYENVSCGEKDCRNLLEESRRLRLGDGDASAIMRYFSRMAAENSGFFFDIELDAEDHLRNVFWADGRSREAYKEFGEVVTFDTTYLTNKYDMPFAPFIGVNQVGVETVNKGCYSQVGVETSTQGSMVSYPHMLQPWGAYQPAQYFPYGHSFVQFQMPGHPHSNA